MNHKIVLYSLDGCPHCKNVKKFFKSNGIDYINRDVGESDAAAEEAVKISGQMGVPVTVIDDETVIVGDDIRQLKALLLEPEGNDISKKVYDLIIIGAGASGLSASIYAARKNIDFIVVSGSVGGMVKQSAVVENFPSYPEISGEKLMNKIYEHAKKAGANFVDDAVTGIIKEDGLFKIDTIGSGTLSSKTVIAATGRSPRLTQAKGEDEFFGKGVAICSTCDGPLYKRKTVGVLGGGNTAFDTAIDMADIAKEVHMIVRGDIKADEALVSKLKSKKNVVYHYGFEIVEFGGNKMLEFINLKNLKDGSIEKIQLSGLFLGIGLDANTRIFDGFVNLNNSKEIVIDQNCKTNVDGFFAAGDSTSVFAKQLTSSVGEGVKALISAVEYLKNN
ncbi:MAG: FAD-dependent oxidoreductase [Methanocorpusculum sp.]|nr:FAD-dependent oxidoreductase [Methanocorpusculum sp.]